MASDALIRAVEVANNHCFVEIIDEEAVEMFAAALDPTDEAMVEAVAARWEAVAGRSSSKMERLMLEAMARDAIAAIRDHITGEVA